MSPLTKSFIYTVVAANVFAISYFGGNYITTGSLAPEAVALIDVDKSSASGATASKTTKEVEVFVASAEQGKKVVGKCKACHTFDAGGKNGIGPNLWAIFEKDVAATEGFAYSSAIAEKKGQMAWTEENLDAWLAKPRDFIPGNKMAFGGITKDQDRANLIAYLKELK